MPRSKPLHRYPQEYYELFEKAQTEEFSLPFDTAARARYVRGELYNLRARLRDALSLDPDQPALAEQYILMENIVIEQNDNVLRLHKRRYKNAAILESVLGRTPAVALADPACADAASHGTEPSSPSILEAFK